MNRKSCNYSILIVLFICVLLVSCGPVQISNFAYPDSTPYLGKDDYKILERIFPSDLHINRMFDESESNLYTSRSSLDEITEFYKTKLVDWEYLGRGINSSNGIEEASWKKGDYLFNIQYLSLPEYPDSFLFIELRHYFKPFYVNPLFWIIVLIIVTVISIITIAQKSRHKQAVKIVKS